MRLVQTIKDFSLEEISAFTESLIADLNAVAIGTVGEFATVLKRRKGNLTGLTRKGDKKGVRAVCFDRKKSEHLGDAFLKFLRDEHPDDPLNERFAPEDGWQLSNPGTLVLIAEPTPKKAKPAAAKPAPAPEKIEFTPKPAVKKKAGVVGGILKRLQGYIPGA